MRHDRGAPVRVHVREHAQDAAALHGVAGKLSMCSRVSSLRHDEARPAISTGRKLVAAADECDAIRRTQRASTSAPRVVAEARAASRAASRRLRRSAALPPTRPVAGSKLTFLPLAEHARRKQRLLAGVEAAKNPCRHRARCRIQAPARCGAGIDRAESNLRSHGETRHESKYMKRDSKRRFRRKWSHALADAVFASESCLPASWSP